MSTITLQVFNPAKSFITQKYNKIIWTNGNVNNIGIYDIENSLQGHFQSSTCKFSLAQLRQWKATVLDSGVGSVNGIYIAGSQGWSENQYVHDSFRPKLTQRNKLWQLVDYSTNGRSLINDSNSSIYFGGTPHWLIPNNGLKVWQQLSDDTISLLNQYRGLSNLDPSITSVGSWHKPKGSLTAGGYSGMAYQSIRPYGWNVFVDYSTSARGPCSQSPRYVHTIQNVTDIYGKSNAVSKIQMKDGVIFSTQRLFKSLRRTQTTLNQIDYNISYSRQEYLQSMQKDRSQPNLLIALVAKSTIPMNLNMNVQLYDSYYQKSEYQLYRSSGDTSIDNVYCNYHQIFSINNSQAPIPTYDPNSNHRQGSSSAYWVNKVSQNWSLDSNWKLYWVMIPLKVFGIQRGLNDIIYNAGRQLINLDKIKISLSVPKGSRNREFYIDFIDAMLSQQISYSINIQQPITITSTLFVGGGFNTLKDNQSRPFGAGYISRSNFVQRNCPPYFFKVNPQRDKVLINYSTSAIHNSVPDLSNVNNRNLVYVNNFRNSKMMYEVF